MGSLENKNNFHAYFHAILLYSIKSKFGVCDYDRSVWLVSVKRK